MQNIEFDFDKTKHVMFSKECEREMKNKISLNYQNDLQDKIWKDVQLKYVEFAKQFNLLEVMLAFCNPDYKAMEAIHAKLIRTTTCSNGNKCDYTIYGNQDEFIKNHPEYVDECGYRRNK